MSRSVRACLLMAGLIAMDAEAAEPEPLTVMTWNLEWFFDDEAGDNRSDLAIEKTAPSRSDWDWRRDAVAKRIAAAHPTVLAVQEVENRRVLWYLSRALDRNHKMDYRELVIEGRDYFTEQDVGMMFRAPAAVLRTTQFSLTDRMRKGTRFYDVSKHLMAVFEFPVGDAFERVTVMNLHLRSKSEAKPIRVRQARLIRHWLSQLPRDEHVIVLGDFNTEQRGNDIADDSELGILRGNETLGKEDDWIDLHLQLPAQQRQTHLLPGRQFDRIFCSPSLFHDDPSKPDLAFRSIQVRADLAVQGARDTPEEHWDQYWKLPANQRDLSDHYPVMATFEVR